MSTDPPVDMGKSSGGLHMSVYKVTEVALTNEEKAQFLEWRQVRDQVVSGEVHYQAILEAARVRQRSCQRGYRTGGSVRRHEGERPDLLALRQEQKVCDHDMPCGCYVEGYAAGRAAARAQHRHDNQENLESLRRVMDRFHRAGN